MNNALTRPEDCERFRVTHTYTIERILREVMDTRTIVSLYVEHGQDFILSSIVALDTKHGILLLEQGVDQDFNRRLLDAGRIVCSATHDQVPIQFTGQDASDTTYENTAVFRVALPKELLRLQRRESYRLATSVVNPVRCLINTGATFLDAVVIDISIGGVGILAYEGSGLLKPGDIYHGCRISLPGTGEFAVSLNVCTTFDVALKNGRLTHRAGCQFIDLPPSVETEIQRYITRTDRERLARYK
ncbi:MAG: flagellar brake protein [Pseudomonadota bacterium]